MEYYPFQCPVLNPDPDCGLKNCLIVKHKDVLKCAVALEVSLDSLFITNVLKAFY